MPDSVEPDDYRFEMIYHEPDSGNQSLLTFIAPPPVYCTGVTIAVNDEMPKMPKLIHMVRRLFPMIVGRELDMSKDDQNTWIVSNETGVPVYRWNEDADDWK
jgi:hypothetical protein